MCSVSYAEITYIDMDHKTGSAGVQEKWSESGQWKNGGRENILSAPVAGDEATKHGGVNTDVQKSVIIGPKAAGRNRKNNDGSIGVGMTVLGHNAIGWNSQATAIGNNVYAGEQGTAIGSDIMAAGYGSIALGNDDIYKNGQGFDDALPKISLWKSMGIEVIIKEKQLTRISWMKLALSKNMEYITLQIIDTILQLIQQEWEQSLSGQDLLPMVILHLL